MHEGAQYFWIHNDWRFGSGFGRKGQVEDSTKAFQESQPPFLFFFFSASRSPFVITEPMIFVEDEIVFPRDLFNTRQHDT